MLRTLKSSLRGRGVSSTAPKKNLHWGYKPGLVSADDRYCGTPNTFKLNVDEGV